MPDLQITNIQAHEPNFKSMEKDIPPSNPKIQSNAPLAPSKKLTNITKHSAEGGDLTQQKNSESKKNMQENEYLDENFEKDDLTSVGAPSTSKKSNAVKKIGLDKHVTTSLMRIGIETPTSSQLLLPSRNQHKKEQS